MGVQGQMQDFVPQAHVHPSSASASEKGSTLGKTFTPSKASVSAGILHGSGYGLGGTSSPLLRPLAPPPGIPCPSVLSSASRKVPP